MDECLEQSYALRMWPSQVGFHSPSQAMTVEDLAGSMRLPTLPDPTEVTNRQRDGWLPTDTVKWTKTSVVFRLPVWHLAGKWNGVWNTPVLSSLLTGRALIAKGRSRLWKSQGINCVLIDGCAGVGWGGNLGGEGEGSSRTFWPLGLFIPHYCVPSWKPDGPD